MYSKRLCELIKNPNCEFYELCINDRWQFEEFCNEIKDSVYIKDFDYIVQLMQKYDKNPLLPKTKFRHLEKGQKNDRNDIYEFKKNLLRVYVILKYPNVYIVKGGYKKNQEKDIKNIQKDTRDLEL